MTASSLHERSETRLQVTTIEVVLNRAELFFASVLETRQSTHPHIGCVHTVFLLSWDLVIGRQGVASHVGEVRPSTLITRSVHPIKKSGSYARLGRSGGRFVGRGLKDVLG